MYSFVYPEKLLFFIPLVIILFILVKFDFVNVREASPEKYRRIIRRRNRLKLIIFLLRALILACIVIALAAPFTDRQVTTKGDTTLTMLVDGSDSMKIYDSSFVDELKKSIEGRLPVKLSHIAYGTRSNIGDNILASLARDTNILLITDGNNNYGVKLGDVSLYAFSLNATINAISMEPKENDVSVAIEGPAEVVTGLESDFDIVLDSAKPIENVPVAVSIDGVVVEDSVISKNKIKITQKFAEGYHKMEARIRSDDYSFSNNVFYKTIYAVPKPKILFVSERDFPMYDLLSQLYDVDKSTTLPIALDDYYAVVLNDINTNSLSSMQVKALGTFVSNGNGLLVIGGQNSFEYGNYKNSALSTMLPVEVGTGEQEPRKDLNLIILIDISQDTGEPDDKTSILESGALRIEKAHAVKVIKEELRANDNIGVVAFSTDAYVVSPMSKVYLKDKNELVDAVSRLSPTKPKLGSRDDSMIAVGVAKSIEMLRGVSGRKYILVLSNGIYGHYGKMTQLFPVLQEEGIKIISIGCGRTQPPRYNSIYTFVDYETLQDMADRTGGIFFPPDNSQYFHFVFGTPLTSEEQEKGIRGIVLLNRYHFITKELQTPENPVPDVSVYGYNKVLPKSSGRLLATTSMGEPLLVIQNYGIGRSAVLATDDGSSWAPGLVGKKNSKFIVRIVNWVIGDPDRKKEYYVHIEDTRINKSAIVEVKSEKIPSAEDMVFYKVEDNLYTSSITPKETGFNELLGVVYAVNYDSEYEKISINPELDSIVSNTGGKIFKPDEVNNIITHVVESSKRTRMEKSKVIWPFIAVALALFLFDIFLRRQEEYRND